MVETAKDGSIVEILARDNGWEILVLQRTVFFVYIELPLKLVLPGLYQFCSDQMKNQGWQ